jgi:hypothetical protein
MGLMSPQTTYGRVSTVLVIRISGIHFETKDCSSSCTLLHGSPDQGGGDAKDNIFAAKRTLDHGDDKNQRLTGRHVMRRAHRPAR